MLLMQLLGREIVLCTSYTDKDLVQYSYRMGTALLWNNFQARLSEVKNVTGKIKANLIAVG